ncbi:hypothetical protein FOR88_28430 [Bacillus anthracis]|nr:hypothetical protein [Bacillus anthracis]
MKFTNDRSLIYNLILFNSLEHTKKIPKGIFFVCSRHDEFSKLIVFNHNCLKTINLLWHKTQIIDYFFYLMKSNNLLANKLYYDTFIT